MSVLITGFPRLLARGLVRRSQVLDPQRPVLLLVDEGEAEDAAHFAASLDHPIEILIGRHKAIDLGLSGEVVRRLIDEITIVFDTTLTRHRGQTRNERADVAGLANLLGLAGEMRHLTRVAIFTTAFVSGTRRGVIYEEDLDKGQAFNSAFERSMFAGEQLARANMPRIPITILRPSAMIGHSRTGESDGLIEGPNYLVRLMLNLPAELPFVLPGQGVVPFNIVPVDYVVHAAWVLAQAPQARGRTFHLTDPNPVSARKACEMLGDLAANRPSPVRAVWPMRLLAGALKVTRLDRLIPDQTALFDDLTRQVTYHCGGTLELLADSDVVCPPFESYAEALVAWVAEYERTMGDIGAT